MKGSLRKIIEVPVICVLFFVAGLLSLFLLVWVAVVSVGLLVRKVVLNGFYKLRGVKDPGGHG